MTCVRFFCGILVPHQFDVMKSYPISCIYSWYRVRRLIEFSECTIFGKGVLSSVVITGVDETLRIFTSSSTTS